MKIPRPPGKPVVGNVLDLNPAAPIAGLVALGKRMGPIFELNMMGKPVTFVWGQRLVDELCDEKRFDKSVRGALHKLRDVGGDGLFTAFTSEPNWSRAHQILLPNFGDRAMASYHPMMLDVAEQLVQKWERLNPDDDIDVVRDMTALTLDTIGICGFGYRFNSLYRDGDHPFVSAMTDALEITMTTRGLPLESTFGAAKAKRLIADVAFMNDLVDRIVRERKAARAAGTPSPAAGGRDFLDVMLDGTDKRTGERLDDTNIRFQIITFLIAGHETTSGLLSFALYFLMNHPEVLARATAEVDAVLGTDPGVSPSYKSVGALRYIRQILKESLRLWPTAPGFALRPYSDEIVGGYEIAKGAQVVVLLPALHRDPSVWGANPETFYPDRFTKEAEDALPRNAYKPFGNGQRACIGQQFALQEAALVLGMILQRFEPVDHLGYELRVRESLTIKPEGLRMKIRRRPRVHSDGTRTVAAPVAAAEPKPAVAGHGTPLLVLFGSNLGTSEDLARQVAETGSKRGFTVDVAPLDAYAERLPASGAVAIVAASYNGAPPDNAIAFCKGLDAASESLAGVRYSVFGAGNRNWASTYQAIPRAIDERLNARGAERLCERGEGDAGEDLDGDFRAWQARLWPAVSAAFGVELGAPDVQTARAAYAVEVVDGLRLNPLARQHGAKTMRVLANRELQTGGDRSTRHIELALPPGTTYRCGDHLGVLGRNADAVVERVLARFGFERDTFVRVSSQGATRIAPQPLDATISLRRLLTSYVEISAVCTRGNLATMAANAECPVTRGKLTQLANDEDAYRDEVRAKRRSVLDVLEAFPACELPFSGYLDMLALMTPRYYSISSSPAAAPDRCSITVGVVRAPAYSGNGIFEGVCSVHLATREEAARVNAFVKPAQSGFALPDDSRTPIVMIGPGTGLAPFRGFVQERRARRDAGIPLGRALLFFGCRRREHDYYYRDELEAAAADGLVELHVAFSREPDRPKTYVQHLIAGRGEDVLAVLDAGGVAYVCGDGSAMEPDVRRTLIELRRARDGEKDGGPEVWFDRLVAAKRYVLDVWAAG